MVNIDEKALSGLLSRIGDLKAEITALENEIRSLCNASQDSAPVSASEPIDISISDIDIPAPPVVEPVEVIASEPEMPAAEEAAEAAPEEAPIEMAAEPEEVQPAEEPVEAQAESAAEASAEDIPEEVPAEEIKAEEDMPEAPEPAVPAAEDIPVEISVEEPSVSEEKAAEAPVEPAKAPEAPADIIDDLPFFDEVPAAKETKKSILDTAKAEKAVMDVMAEKQAWRIDRPGSQVKNVISAISLNDRVLLINVLFKEDPMLFQDTISAFNGMSSLDEAISYINEKFPEWDLNSEPVYRLMMAVRRKLS